MKCVFQLASTTNNNVRFHKVFVNNSLIGNICVDESGLAINNTFEPAQSQLVLLNQEVMEEIVDFMKKKTDNFNLETALFYS